MPNSFGGGPQVGVDPYETKDTLYFANYFGGFLSCNSGFRFEFFDTHTQRRRAAESFFNEGLIKCGTPDQTNLNVNVSHFLGLDIFLFFTTYLDFANLFINATNIVHHGDIELGFQSHSIFSGNNVDLSRGSILMSSVSTNLLPGSSFLFNGGGLYDGYWGPISNAFPRFFDPRTQFENPAVQQTPAHAVQYRSQLIDYQHVLVLSNALTFVSDLSDFENNRFVRAVFLNNTNAAISASVFFPDDPWANTNVDAFGYPLYGDIMVEWSWMITNGAGLITTNYLQLADSLGDFPFLRIALSLPSCSWTALRVLWLDSAVHLYSQHLSVRAQCLPAHRLPRRASGHAAASASQHLLRPGAGQLLRRL